MGKHSRKPARDGEVNENKKLKLQNQALRRQIQTLRKELNKIDIDRYQYLKDLVQSQAKKDEQVETTITLNKLKDKWECFTCGKDFLRLVIIPKADKLYYMRRCPTCLYKTRLKPYTDSIEGLTDDATTISKNKKLDK
jgi:DNA-directed RNA polymerase subunit RPC12/RpoP